MSYEARTATLPPATRALMAALLVNHSIKATWLLLNMAISGQPVSRAQVRNARQGFMRDKRAAAGDDAARTASTALTQAPPAAPVPAIVTHAPTSAVQRRPLSFDEQMARVAAGARLVMKPDLRPVPPAVTLGGVASGMI